MSGPVASRWSAGVEGAVAAGHAEKIDVARRMHVAQLPDRLLPRHQALGRAPGGTATQKGNSPQPSMPRRSGQIDNLGVTRIVVSIVYGK